MAESWLLLLLYILSICKAIAILPHNEVYTDGVITGMAPYHLCCSVHLVWGSPISPTIRGTMNVSPQLEKEGVDQVQWAISHLYAMMFGDAFSCVIPLTTCVCQSTDETPYRRRGGAHPLSTAFLVSETHIVFCMRLFMCDYVNLYICMCVCVCVYSHANLPF